MKNLWIYGCSFSEPFGLTPISKPPIINEDGSRDFLGTDYWGSHLAKKMNLNLITKSLSGIGWNYITHHIDLDILKWHKDDIIIISPSFLSRFSIMEFNENGARVEDYVHLLRDINQIVDYNEIRWKTKIITLQKLGFNVYTWLVNDCVSPISDIKNLIKTPENLTNFKDWMDLHKEFWIDPTTNKYPMGDWHFNERGHVAVSEIMYDFISKNLYK
jgi:hypothetical protein